MLINSSKNRRNVKNYNPLISAIFGTAATETNQIDLKKQAQRKIINPQELRSNNFLQFY
jgi:hypothetical protein